MNDDRLVVGLVRGVHGLRGALRVETLSDNEDRFTVGSVVYAEGSDRPLTIISAQRDGPGLLIRFKEVGDRNAADRLRDTYLVAAPGAALPADTYYWHDIIGCSVETAQGQQLGNVDDIFRVGESEVFVVHGPRGEVLVPAVQSIVRELNPAKRRIVVDTDALGLNDSDDEGEATES